MKNVFTRECIHGAGGIVIMLVAGAAIGADGCGRKAGPAMAPPPTTVQVVEVVQRDIPLFTDWVATTDGLVNATIRAQVQGYLLTQNYRQGDFVRKGQLLFEIDPRPFEAAVKQAQGVLSQSEAALNQAKAAVVYFGISEQDYIATVKKYAGENGFIKHGLAVEHRLILADGTVYPQPGTFYAMDRQVDLTTGTLRVELLFPNPGNVLRPGQFARVRTVEQRKGALLIPQRAVTELQGLRQVAVVGPDDTIEIRPIKTSVQTATYWVVDEGLTAGEHVVSAGTEKVGQGMKVNPVPETRQAGQSTDEPGGPAQPGAPAGSASR